MMPMPPGSVWTTGQVVGFLYVCNPSLVTSDPRYASPRSLYYERMARVARLPLYRLSVTVAPGQPMSHQPSAPFPDDFERAMIVGYSIEDVAWMALLKPTPPYDGINIEWEPDNDRRVRHGHGVLVPFKRSVFPHVKVAGANDLGDPNGVTIQGWGTVHYVKLPADW